MENTLNTQRTARRNETAVQYDLDGFKRAVNELLAKREYFASKVMPFLKEGQDYYTIRGRRSLAKGGAEKLASMYGLVATFERDRETAEMLGDVKGMVAYVCTLTKNGRVAGQGRGADTLARNGNDPNKTIKLAQKRAYVDAVIRATSLSDIFTQDLEDMDPAQIQPAPRRKRKSDLPERPQEHIVAVKKRLHELGAKNETEALQILTERSGLKLDSLKKLENGQAKEVLEFLR